MGPYRVTEAEQIRRAKDWQPEKGIPDLLSAFHAATCPYEHTESCGWEYELDWDGWVGEPAPGEAHQWRAQNRFLQRLVTWLTEGDRPEHCTEAGMALIKRIREVTPIDEIADLRAAAPASAERVKLFPKAPEEIEEPEAELTDEDRAFYKYVMANGLDTKSMYATNAPMPMWDRFRFIEAAIEAEDERANKRIERIVVRHKLDEKCILIIIALDDGRKIESSHPIGGGDTQVVFNGRVVRRDAK